MGSLLLPAVGSCQPLSQGIRNALFSSSINLQRAVSSSSACGHHCQEVQDATRKWSSTTGCSASSSSDGMTFDSSRHSRALQPQQQQLHVGSLPQPGQQQQLRGFAAKGKGKAAAAPAPPPPKPPKPVDPYAPPEFKMKHVPRSVKDNPIDQLTEPQKALLQQLAPGSGPLRSLRQVGWPLGSKQLLALLHDQLSDASGTNVQIMPFMLQGLFSSAITLATRVKEAIEEGQGLPRVEQQLLTTISNLPADEVTFDGIKIQVKGRLSGKGGMATKRVWNWGKTSTATLADPVDYANEVALTRAGHVGVKVWIRYKRKVMQPQEKRSIRSSITVPQLLAKAGPVSLPSRSSSAWWNTPGPLQPQRHRTWECFKQGYDPLTANLNVLQQQQRHIREQSYMGGPVAGAADTRPGSTELQISIVQAPAG